MQTMGAAMSPGLLPAGISRALAGDMTSTPWDRAAGEWPGLPGNKTYCLTC